MGFEYRACQQMRINCHPIKPLRSSIKINWHIKTSPYLNNSQRNSASCPQCSCISTAPIRFIKSTSAAQEEVPVITGINQFQFPSFPSIKESEMTSTNIFKGISEERNSSRVLRPPGGGQTDVLGLCADPHPVQARKANLRNVSSITEGTNVTVDKAPVAAPAPVISPVESPQEPPPKIEAPPAPAAPQKEAAPALTGYPFSGSQQPPPAQPTRARVPPGGYSSGLW